MGTTPKYTGKDWLGHRQHGVKQENDMKIEIAEGLAAETSINGVGSKGIDHNVYSADYANSSVAVVILHALHRGGGK